MTQEQIHELSEEYVESRLQLVAEQNTNWAKLFEQEFELALNIILRDHLITEKSKVKRLNSIADRIYDNSYDEYRRCECMGYMQALKDTFPTFNPTEK